jgi:hypothetical protein
MKRKIISPILLCLAFYICAFAQPPLQIGDVVEYRCNCFGQEWVDAKVEAVSGDSLSVRYGNMRNQVATGSISSGVIRMKPRKPSVAEIERWNAFHRDASPYYESVKKFAPFFDAQYVGGGLPNNPAEWLKTMNDLAELDTLCRTRYPGITDQSDYVRKELVDYRFGVWCQIAAARARLEKPAREELAKNQVTLTVTKDNLNFAFKHQKNRVPDETQLLMYDRTKWKQDMTAKLKPRFAEFQVEMPADFFAEVEKKADELKTLIDNTAPNRAWEQPPFRDAAVEAFIKSKYAAEYRGAQVLKIGLDYNTWVERKGLSYLGSDSTFRYYKVEYNYYKRGWLLMKTPNRPYCQASEWIVGKSGKGMVAVTLGGSAIFVKCP